MTRTLLWHQVLAALPDDISVIAFDAEASLTEPSSRMITLDVDNANVVISARYGWSILRWAVSDGVAVAAHVLEVTARRLAAAQHACGTDESLPAREAFRARLDPTLVGFFRWWQFNNASAWPRRGVYVNLGSMGAGPAVHALLADWVDVRTYDTVPLSGYASSARAYHHRRDHARPQLSCDDRTLTPLPAPALVRRQVGWPRAPPVRDRTGAPRRA